MLDDIVIGGGIAGLTLAFRLRQRGHDVAVLEASGRAGGLVHTVRRDGVILEQGPQTLQSTPEVVQLVSELGLMGRVVAPTAASSTRWILRDGRLVALPHGPGELLRSPLLRPLGALRALAEPLVPQRRIGPETVAAFMARRFGAGVLPLVDAFVAGVFAGDPRQLEVDSAFEDLVSIEAAHRSVLLGGARRARDQRRRTPLPVPRPLFALVDGQQELIGALAASLGDTLRLESPALSLRRTDAWRVSTPLADLVGQRVWLACPLTAAARLLDAPDLTVPRAPIASVHLGWRREQVPDPLPGFGWLAPSTERRDVLGCLWVSGAFPGHAPGRTLLRVMIGGARAPELVDADDETLVAHARRVVREVQGIDAEPDLVDVAAYPSGIPQYPLGHAAAVAGWQERWPSLRFVGWGVGGVGVSHAVRTAARVVRGG